MNIKCFSQNLRIVSKNPPCLNHVETFPDHWDDRTGSHVADQLPEESLLAQVRVVPLQQAFWGLHELASHHFEAPLLEPLDNVADEIPMDSVRFQHDKGSLGIGWILAAARGTVAGSLGGNRGRRSGFFLGEVCL